MSMNDTIKTADEYLLHTYNRYPIVFDHGEGVRLYDADGKEYLDFCSGIAVFALGYGNKRYEDALKRQIEKVTHVSNYYYSEPLADAAKLITKASGMSKVFFTNSGAEAVEGAIKAARKYAYLKDNKTDHEIIAMEHSFHGRTFGALSVTGNAHYREAFEPMIGNVKFANFNDYDSVASLVNDRTCAIIMETVQGEGGIYPAEDDFIKGVRKLCDEKDILLILDEIQCGMGRTGYMFAWEKYGVKPDVVTMAKAIGNGVPVGAFAMTEKVAEHSLVPGDHGTTYGGNPFACAAVREVLRQFEESHVVEHVKELTPSLTKALDELKEKHDNVCDRRGAGFMQALELTVPCAPVIKKAQENGLIVISAGANTLRLVPPLVIEADDIRKMQEILDKALTEA